MSAVEAVTDSRVASDKIDRLISLVGMAEARKRVRPFAE
jgi:hypothetical protein